MPKDFSETSAEVASEELCEKCGNNPRAKSHKWCAECKAEAQSRYMAGRDGMFQSKGYTQGVKDMRELLAAEFAKLGTAFFRGDECAALILRAPGPAFNEEKAATPAA